METLFLALRVLVSLVAVLALLWYLQRRLSRRAGRHAHGTKPVTVVTRQQIAPKASVVIVEVDGQRLLLGVTEHAVNVLTNTTAAAPSGTEAAPAVQPSPAVSSVAVITSTKPAQPDDAPAPSSSPTRGELRPRRRAAPARETAFASALVKAQRTTGGQAAAGRTTAGRTTASWTSGGRTIVGQPGPAPIAYLPARNDPLQGSILSPGTWRRAAAAFRRTR